MNLDARMGIGQGALSPSPGAEHLPHRRLESWEAAALDCCPNCGDRVASGKYLQPWNDKNSSGDAIANVNFFTTT